MLTAAYTYEYTCIYVFVNIIKAASADCGRKWSSCMWHCIKIMQFSESRANTSIMRSLMFFVGLLMEINRYLSLMNCQVNIILYINSQSFSL